MIEIIDLTKRFGRFKAVDCLNLNVKKGELFGFLGPNGAGKTTTIKMMAGLLQPTSGTVKLDGYDILRNPEEAKSLFGLIPDRPFLYGKLTGHEFLEFTAALYKLDPKRAKQRADELMEFFELLDWKDELIESYSHGMRQKLTMIAALLHQAPLLIIDEPMVGLDPKTSRMVKDLFRKMCQNGATLFISTHTLDLAQELCSRICIIQEGKVVAIGTMEELRHQASDHQGRLEAVFLKLTHGSEEKDVTQVWSPNEGNSSDAA